MNLIFQNSSYMYFLDLDEVVLYHFLGPESQFENFRFSNNFFMMARTLTVADVLLMLVESAEKSSHEIVEFHHLFSDLYQEDNQ